MSVNYSNPFKNSKGFVLFAVLIILLFAGILFGYMQENLRLASFVELHAKQKLQVHKSCEAAAKKIFDGVLNETKNSEVEIHGQKFKYDLTQIILPAKEQENNLVQSQLGEQEFGDQELENQKKDQEVIGDKEPSDNKENKIYFELKLQCSTDNKKTISAGAIEAVFDPVEKNILSWKDV